MHPHLEQGHAAPASRVEPFKRSFLCPACRGVSLQAVLDPVVVARCGECGFTAQDLLSLVPIEPAPLLTLALGQGLLAWVRLAGFAGVVALLLTVLLLGR